MDETNKTGGHPPDKDSRATLINTVQTPLGFFVLLVLIVEAILGIVAAFSTGNDKTYLIIGMLVLIFLLVFIVAGMAIFRPMSLYGMSAKSKDEKNSDSSSTLQDIVTGTRIVERPEILWAASSFGVSTYTSLPVEQEIRSIQESFPKSKISVEENVTADRFRELLTQNKFDIVQLTANVRKHGDVDFWQPSGKQTIPGEGIVQLLEVSETKLLILASCNSVPLAAKLAGRVNMIAATGNLADVAFRDWQATFFRLLSKGTLLSQAYGISKDSVQFELPLAMIVKQDVVFKD
jgi:hypothetical protein